MPSTNLDGYFAKVFKPGAAILTSGFKGGGKSHTAVAVAEQLVKGVYPSVGEVEVFTNMIFFHKVRGEILEECPPGVHRITTMKELFPMLMDSIRRHDGKVLNLVILDEAQGFIGGDSNMSNASIMMKELLGIIRKFKMAIWFLTPSSMSVGPSFRNYLNDKKYPGNLTAKFRKDLAFNERYISEHHLPYRPQELMLVKNFDSPAVVLRVPVTEWTGVRQNLKEGGYCYDHEAPATFYVGDDFDWQLFNRTIGGVSSLRMEDTIRQYYAEHHPEGVGTDPGATAERKRIAESANLDLAVSMLESGRLKQSEVADLLGLTRDQLQYRLRKRTDYYAPKEDAGGIRIVGGKLSKMPVRDPSRDDADKTDASALRACVKGAQKKPPIYISSKTPCSTGDRGVFSRSGEVVLDDVPRPSEGPRRGASGRTRDAREVME